MPPPHLALHIGRLGPAFLLTGPGRLRDAAGEWTWARRTPPWRLERGEVPTRPPWPAPAVALLAAALTVAAPVAAATARRGAPLLWRVEWYGRRSHLFGTVHLPLDLDAALGEEGRAALLDAKARVPRDRHLAGRRPDVPAPGAAPRPAPGKGVAARAAAPARLDPADGGHQEFPPARAARPPGALVRGAGRRSPGGAPRPAAPRHPPRHAAYRPADR